MASTNSQYSGKNTKNERFLLRDHCCETCRNIPQKTPMKEFIKKNSLTRQILFSERLKQLLINKGNI